MRELLLERWNEVGDKLVLLVAEFPAERFEFRAAAAARSFAEQARHVAFWNRYVDRKLRGEAADGEANELPAAEFPDRASIVQALRESQGAVAATLAGSSGDDDAAVRTLLPFLEHNCEHYG